MTRLESYPYVADDLKPHPGMYKAYKGIRPEAHEYYYEIQGFELEHPNGIDYELSFGMRYVDGKMVKRAAKLKMTWSELQQLKHVLNGDKFPQGTGLKQK